MNSRAKLPNSQKTNNKGFFKANFIKRFIRYIYNISL